MNETNQITNPQLENAEDEIDLIALFKTAWNNRKIIIFTTIVFFIIGLFVAMFSTNQYSVTTIMAPQVSSGSSRLGGLSSLAAMAGVGLDMSSGSDLNPVIYPRIVQSIPYQKKLMYTKLNFKNYKEKIRLYDYLTDPQYSKFSLLGFIRKYTIGLPSTIISAIRGNKIQEEGSISDDTNQNIVDLTLDERGLVGFLSSNVYLNVEQRQGYITLTAIMPEALAAAQLAQSAQTLLQEKITEFKLEKSKAQLDFILGRYNEKKSEYEAIQKRLAIFRDRNKNVTTALASTEENRLENEFQLAFSVYSELAKQLENAQIQVKKETPVFLIIQPSSVPADKFKPKRKQILFIWVFIGILIGVTIVFGKDYYYKIRKDWQNLD